MGGIPISLKTLIGNNPYVPVKTTAKGRGFVYKLCQTVVLKKFLTRRNRRFFFFVFGDKKDENVENSITDGIFNSTFKATPRFPAEIFGVETVARSLFVPGTLFQGLFQQSQD